MALFSVGAARVCVCRGQCWWRAIGAALHLLVLVETVPSQWGPDRTLACWDSPFLIHRCWRLRALQEAKRRTNLNFLRHRWLETVSCFLLVLTVG